RKRSSSVAWVMKAFYSAVASGRNGPARTGPSHPSSARPPRPPRRCFSSRRADLTPPPGNGIIAPVLTLTCNQGKPDRFPQLPASSQGRLQAFSPGRLPGGPTDGCLSSSQPPGHADPPPCFCRSGLGPGQGQPLLGGPRPPPRRLPRPGHAHGHG